MSIHVIQACPHNSKLLRSINMHEQSLLMMTMTIIFFDIHYFLALISRESRREGFSCTCTVHLTVHYYPPQLWCWGRQLTGGLITHWQLVSERERASTYKYKPREEYSRSERTASDRAREKSQEGELESVLLLDCLWSMGTDKTYQEKEIKECENSCAHNFEVVLVSE